MVPKGRTESSSKIDEEPKLDEAKVDTNKLVYPK